jgi:hypothetical protein
MTLAEIPKEQWTGKIVEVCINQGAKEHKYQMYYRAIVVPSSRKSRSIWAMVKPLENMSIRSKAVNPKKARLIQ